MKTTTYYGMARNPFGFRNTFRNREHLRSCYPNLSKVDIKSITQAIAVAPAKRRVFRVQYLKLQNDRPRRKKIQVF